jgi:hypothetical protein
MRRKEREKLGECKRESSFYIQKKMCLISRHIHILLPFLVPSAAGLFGPDAGLFGYLTALDAEARVAVVTGVTGADDMLLL